MKGKKNFCQIYIAKIDDFKSNDRLPGFLQKEIEGIKNIKVKNQKIAAYGLLHKAVKETLDFDDDFSLIKKEKSGKPVCKKYFFSISHSQELVAVAVSNTNIGVDIEIVKERKNIKNLKQVVFHENEKILNVENIDDFIKFWVKKEALFKFEGGKVFFPKNIDTTKFDCQTYYFDYKGQKYWIGVATEQNNIQKKLLF